MGELKSYGANLETRPMVMVASKIDVADGEKLKKLRAWAKRRKLPLYEISAVSGKGIPELNYALSAQVEELRLAEREAAAAAKLPVAL